MSEKQETEAGVSNKQNCHIFFHIVNLTTIYVHKNTCLSSIFNVSLTRILHDG